MVFSSTAFLFLFLPVFLGIYFLVPARHRSVWILVASWFYYGWWRVDFLLLLVATSFWTWFVGTRIAHVRHEDRQKPTSGRTESRARAWRAAGVVLPLVVLGYFKYFNFGMDTLNQLIRFSGGTGLSVWRVILPVGISFYTFQIISYVVDVYRGTVPPGRTFVDVAAYISLFPQLVAGPIVRYKDIASQFIERPHGWDTFVAGVPRFMIGLARKVLIADAVAPIADAVFATSSPGLAAAWIGTLAYAVQIYFDFAAYSDMAIGLGRMMGFTIPENFNMPYTSGSITEFWRRWHMTLSTWLRDYLYIPLGGNRRGAGRTLVNLMTVMLLGGLWHGAAWSFVVWGAWHGLWLIAERLVFHDRARAVGSVPYQIVTIVVVLVSWILFRAESLPAAFDIIGGFFGFHGAAVGPDVSWQLTAPRLAALAAGLAICATEPALRNILSGDFVPNRPRPGAVLAGAALAAVFMFSVLRVIAGSYSPFLYFRF